MENVCILRSSRWLKTADNWVWNNTCYCHISGLSYASHTVGFTPPTSLTRAGMSYYNSPGLHVQHMGASHGITVSSHRAGSHTLLLLLVATGPPQETRPDALRHLPFFSLPPSVHLQTVETSSSLLLSSGVESKILPGRQKFQLHFLWKIALCEMLFELWPMPRLDSGRLFAITNHCWLPQCLHLHNSLIPSILSEISLFLVSLRIFSPGIRRNLKCIWFRLH